MSTYISLNTKFLPAHSPIFTVDNRAFRYGDSLFETIKCVDGIPLFLSAHLHRLAQGMAFLSFEQSEQLTASILNDLIKKLLVKNRHTQGARVRLSVFRNSGGYYTPEVNSVSILIESQADSNTYILNKEGLKLGIYKEILKPIYAFNSLKSANALLFVKAGLSKIKSNLDDLIILNERERICETISANIFMVIQNKIVTPPLSEGCLPGVMRQNIISLIPSLGFEVVQTPLGINAFAQAQEVFTTNAITGVNWVIGYQQKRYFHKVSDQINQALNNAIKMDK